MLPLVALAASVVPKLIKLLAGDDAGKVAQTVAQAVSDSTGTNDPNAARKKLDEDPQIAAALRIKLAEIALQATRLQNEKEAAERSARLQAEEKQRQDALAVLRTQFQHEQATREAQFTEQQALMKAQLDNTISARTFGSDLAKAGSPLAWAPLGISVIVTLLFAAAFIILLSQPTAEAKSPYADLINICIGALVAGFSTVISYWLGSSQGSKEKDLANKELQAAQTVQATKQLEVSSQQAKAYIEATSATAQQQGARAPVQVPPPAKTSTFDECFQLVLGSEGGFVNNPDDPGGATKFGITIGTLTDWRKSKLSAAAVTIEDVKALTVEEAKEIYRANYWNRLRCGDLRPGLDLVVFDFGVNAGPATSAKILQRILGVDQDGSIGPVTINGVSACDPLHVIREFSARRLEFYKELPGFVHFGAGWTARTNSMEQAALRMAGLK